jgi:hypothetical protein
MKGKACQGGARLVCQRHHKLNVCARGSDGGADDKGTLDPVLVLEGERPTPRAPGYRQRTATAGFGHQLIEVVAPRSWPSAHRRQTSSTRWYMASLRHGPSRNTAAPTSSRMPPASSRWKVRVAAVSADVGVAPHDAGVTLASGRTYRFTRNRGSLTAAFTPPFDRYRDEPQPCKLVPPASCLAKQLEERRRFAADGAHGEYARQRFTPLPAACQRPHQVGVAGRRPSWLQPEIFRGVPPFRDG